MNAAEEKKQDVFNEAIDDKKENEIINEVENKVENNVVQNNIIQNNSANTVQNEKNSSSSIIGKEEQASIQENTEEQRKNKAIELAKKEWGLSTDSYNFEPEKDGNMYKVTVRNKTNSYVVAIYVVDVNSGLVHDITEQ